MAKIFGLIKAIQKLPELERKMERHDGEIKVIFDVIRKLMAPPDKPKKKIGFGVAEPRVKYGGKKKTEL